MQSMPGNEWEWFVSLESEYQIALIVIAVLTVVAVVGFVCAALYGMHKNRLEAALKRELVDRGMSAEEIATVISARPGKSRKCLSGSESNA